MEGRRYLINNKCGYDRIDLCRVSFSLERGRYTDIEEINKYGLGGEGVTSWRVLERYGEGSIRSVLGMQLREVSGYEESEWSVIEGNGSGGFIFGECDISGLSNAYVVLNALGVESVSRLLNSPEVIISNRSEIVAIDRLELGTLSIELQYTFYSNLDYFDININVINDRIDGVGDIKIESLVLYLGNIFASNWFKDKNNIEDNVNRVCLMEKQYLGDMQGKAYVFTCCNASHYDGGCTIDSVMSSVLGHVLCNGLIGISEGWGYEGKVGEIEEWGGGGLFGSWGDVKLSATTGTPRNGICSNEFYNTVNGKNDLVKLYGKALQQACRISHLEGLRVEEDDDTYLWWIVRASGNKFNRDKLESWYFNPSTDPYRKYRPDDFNPYYWFPNGWSGYDTEHWSIDLLYDAYRLTGDDWFKREIAKVTEWLNGYMRFSKYGTQYCQSARAEGWCLNAWVMAHRVLGDDRIRSYAIRRLGIVDRDRWSWHPSKALNAQFIPVEWSQYPTEHIYSAMPWQHGAVGIGYLRAWEQFGDKKFLDIAYDIVTLFKYAFVPETPGLRYYCPLADVNKDIIPVDSFDNIKIHYGDSPLGGAHQFLVSPLYILSKLDHPLAIDAGKAFNYLYDGGKVNKWNYGINKAGKIL